ncbi:hypothetical protein [Paenibacillus alkalitolerans]|uniref:hypothetical protein n=1 Tax=Paenibacillus alkalitolerans TaxID=2799335 RepID=UPI001F460483|nr:hypothetical protein [Paenibacillus alkalitolerans]
MTEEREGVIEVFAIWEYNSHEEYQNIEKQVKSDKVHVKRVRNQHEKLRKRGEGLLKEVPKEDFLLSTVPRNKTILGDFP